MEEIIDEITGKPITITATGKRSGTCKLNFLSFTFAKNRF